MTKDKTKSPTRKSKDTKGKSLPKNQPQLDLEEKPQTRKQSPPKRKSTKFTFPLKARSSSRNRDDIEGILESGTSPLTGTKAVDYANRSFHETNGNMPDYQIKTEIQEINKSPFMKRKSTKVIEIEKWFPIGSKGRAIHRQKLVAQAIKTIDFTPVQNQNTQRNNTTTRYKTEQPNIDSVSQNISLSMNNSTTKLHDTSNRGVANKTRVKLAPLMGGGASPDQQLGNTILAPRIAKNQDQS